MLPLLFLLTLAPMSKVNPIPGRGPIYAQETEEEVEEEEEEMAARGESIFVSQNRLTRATA